jgi:predicted dehydrogenase
MEKPVHRSLVQALEIERRIDETGVLHAAGFHNRYLPQAIVARDAIADTTVGLVMGFAFWSQPGGHNLTSYHSWLFNRDLGGGQIFEHTTHIFDLCRYFVGEVRSVYCRQATRLDHSNIPGYSSADVDAVVLEFENGVVGLVGDGHVTPTSYWWGLRVMTDQGIFEYDANSLRTIRQERAEEYQPDLPDGIHMPQDATFIEAVRTGDRSLIRSDYRNGIKNMAVSLAALESADCGQPVEVAAVLESAERASR